MNSVILPLPDKDEVNLHAKMKRSWFFVKRRSFRSKLLISYALLVLIPISIMGTKYYYASKGFIEKFTRENLYSIVKQNNEIIDAELSKIEDNSLAMIGDPVLYEQYLNANPRDEYGMVTMEKNVRKALEKYLPESSQLYSYHLLTSYSNIGNSAFITYQTFSHTKLYQAALAGNGAMRWVPTFSFQDMFGAFGQESSTSSSYPNLMAGVRMLKLFQINNNAISELSGIAEPPVLVITFKPEMYTARFESTMPSDGASFFIVSPQGTFISGSDSEQEGKDFKPPWLEQMKRLKTGAIKVEQDGKALIICFDTSEVTGWISGIIVSPNMLIDTFMPQITSYTIYLGLALLLVSLILAFFFAESITRPINQLIKAIKKTGDGDFGTRVPIRAYDEMGHLIRKYNQMNEKINSLIEENYIVKLREKETQIMSLNIQLNPHFLYNTLNMMNWTALENNQKELSRMIVSLSSMLQYTSENHQDIGEFHEDLKWLHNYFYIIDQRFEGKFIVQYDINPELYPYTVPKLFLQPFVENAIIHGFAHIHRGGIIQISGYMIDGKRCFTVQDNGKGISSKQMKLILKRDNNSIGIQNVDKRIKLIYGESFGVTLHSEVNKGTTVNIVLPL
ncbi:sensor histidine kinase [Paenibacillus sp. R14(2021)]|uniref:cache domain-containing sensor histidine kinase n=1 Tax=Paenibacillus sp. R14(2021) TaxID=2859228 RepID=UPI001C615853|nr:sensor histidine kinase [Paenibacillus sp. R14(2021)]